jgi:hypothetical protein
MHIAVAGSHGPEWRTQKSPDGIEDRLTKRQPAGRIADQRTKDISSPQGQSNRHAQRFLTPPQKDATVDFSHAVETGKFVIQNPRQQHEAEGLHWRSFRGSRLSLPTYVEGRLNHVGKLARRWLGLQCFFTLRNQFVLFLDKS